MDLIYLLYKLCFIQLTVVKAARISPTWYAM